MKTVSAKPAEVERDWWIIDAEDLVLGRLATKVATVLRGKHKPIFTPHTDTGDFVVVVNAEKIRVTGKKEEKKVYWHYTGFPGGARSVSLKSQRLENPDRVIAHAVKGMLPKGPLGRKMFKKLKVYGGAEHPHKAQKPQTLSL
jgi:large subunit ribosomal protein L13